MRALSMKELRQDLDLALRYYTASTPSTTVTTGGSESKYISEEIRKVLIQVREQLNRPKKF